MDFKREGQPPRIQEIEQPEKFILIRKLVTLSRVLGLKQYI